MTNKEAIKYLQQIYPNGGHCWLDEQRIEAISMAIKALQEEPVSNPTPNGKMSVERWKKACEAACCDINYRSHYGLTETRDDYFVDGVQWADEHPKEESVSEKKCMFAKDSYTDEDRKTLCEDCKEKCEYSKKEEPVSDDLKGAAHTHGIHGIHSFRNDPDKIHQTCTRCGCRVVITYSNKEGKRYHTYYDRNGNKLNEIPKECKGLWDLLNEED